mmetsp:Transcript_20513/g.37058  ORF Transcript_20513/g.37058 Transcript_20513/m.37058 type:complete len:221 (-) Transcript_20513:652-1314(-)
MMMPAAAVVAAVSALTMTMTVTRAMTMTMTNWATAKTKMMTQPSKDAHQNIYILPCLFDSRAEMGVRGRSPSCVPSMQIPYQSKCTVFNSILSGMFAVSRVYLRYFSMSSKKYTSVGPVRRVKLFSASIRLISELPPLALRMSLGFLPASSSRTDSNCHFLSSARAFSPVIATPLSFCTALHSSALRDCRLEPEKRMTRPAFAVILSKKSVSIFSAWCLG